MKNIVKSFLAVCLALVSLASCVKASLEPLSTSVGVSTNELVLPDTGNARASFTVSADGDWIATSTNESWFTFSPATGTGAGEIFVTADPNTDAYGEINGPRSGQLTVIGADGMQVVTIKQNGEAGLDASRTYSKVTSASDLEAGKAYMIVANTGSDKIAAKSFAASSESYYSYIYGDTVEEKDGTIVRPNANNGYTFVAKDGGYAIMQPNGRYLFQAAAYNNFYSTTDLAKADVWTVTVNSDGTAKIENQTVGGKYFQYSIGYSSYGAYGSEQSNAVMPSLYKDSAAPSDEVLTVAENTDVAASATSVSIPVSSNKTWKVRNHDSWITSFTKSGSGDGTIDITFTANESYEAARTATFTVIGETTNFEITLTQDHLYQVIDVTVAEFKEKESGDQLYRLTGKVRGIVNDKYGNIYIEDGTDYVYVYTLFENDEKVSQSFANLGLREGDIVTIVGPRSQYDNAKVEDQKIQMKNAYCEKAIIATDATVTEVLAAPVASTYLESAYYRVTGIVKEIASDVYGNIYLQEKGSDANIYLYGLTNAPVAKNNKSFASLGIAVGDEITIVGQRGEYKGSVQMANSFFVSKVEETEAE
ncbi:MAG: BACON domain-containing protein [Bacteroidales bacterium]|nr:BACON domain-containing protein [Bacteroidales bacterium]